MFVTATVVQALNGMNLTVGVVVPLDEMHRSRFSVSELSTTLEVYAIEISPTETQGPSYDSFYFFLFRDGTVRMYDGAFMSRLPSRGGGKTKDGRFQLYNVFTENALSFTPERSDKTEINAPTVGPEKPGLSTGHRVLFRTTTPVPKTGKHVPCELWHRHDVRQLVCGVPEHELIVRASQEIGVRHQPRHVF
ncbi:hypothetical protein MRX96_010536 [Rhipicephalus microplus]